MDKTKYLKRPVSVLAAVLIALFVLWDLKSSVQFTVQQGVFRNAAGFSGAKAGQTDVAVVPSDLEGLASPALTTDANITYRQIEDMVRKAVELQGGWQGIVKPGDRVLIKPNIVDPEPPGSGEVTDVRVVKALVKLIHEFTQGNVRITIAEGAPRVMRYELPYSTRSAPQWTKLWDAAGYPGLFSDPDLAGVPFDTLNLNGSPPNNPWQDLLVLNVPGGGTAAPQKGSYVVHKAVKEADVYITVPVLKIHNPGITSALKNQIGLAACTKYGYPKTSGVGQNGYANRLRHATDFPRDWTDEEIVDLSAIAHIDLAVVDAIVTLEKEKSAVRSNGVITNAVRFNTIIAGKDPVAVDHVCAELAGINPDDVDHICLAAKTGLGTNRPEDIHVLGRSVASLAKRLRKKTTDFQLMFGRGNREWILSKAFPTDGISDPMNHAFLAEEARLEPMAGQDGWSDAVYFFDDRIDLKSYFNTAGGVVSYAFTYFTSPSSGAAELWIGSDEAVIIYLNQNPVYAYGGTRSFALLLSERVPVTLQAGENTLLVKTLQRYGNYDFALNLCEVESDPELAGNRVRGLQFHPASNATGVAEPEVSALPGRFAIKQNWPNPFNAQTQISFSLSSAGPLTMTVFSPDGRPVRRLAGGFYPAGSHRVLWDGLDERGLSVSSGLYLCVLQTKDGSSSRKLTLLK